MKHILTAALAFSSLLAAPLAAQEDLSVEELTRLFERQKEAFNEATTNGLGQSRGLKLVTVEDATAAQGSTTVTAQADPTPTDPNKPIAATPVVFGKLDPELQVNLRITFGFDSAALSDAEKPKLDKMCQVLRQSDINLVRVVGHTDTSGSAQYNERLSMLRAQEVARHLTESCGIAAERLQTIGMGERFPANPADSRADENRRVEFQALS
ncbi:OmpA family protein [uncultured Sulfitobacter sp.]|uniref:OmpA family protein n=1 Tax=uncultured Sulfitobacter sp. TaxID=191468 RepID=UPI0026235C89|nr:OmpA family protein [uncultured Sulfitobacter sp.]